MSFTVSLSLAEIIAILIVLYGVSLGIYNFVKDELDLRKENRSSPFFIKSPFLFFHNVEKKIEIVKEPYRSELYWGHIAHLGNTVDCNKLGLF
jgi:hypothetical protein